MIIGVLQARMSSQRLPGKVLAPVLGEPMIARQIKRLQRARRLDRLIVATSVDASDDPLALACRERGISVHRGSLRDVLERYVEAVSPCAADGVVRLTADCPLADWTVVDRVIEAFLARGVDYVSNIDPPTYPDGLDVEVMTSAALQQAHRDARSAAEREHVTLHIRRRPQTYSRFNVTHERDLSAMRWTVDEHEDLEFVRAVYARLYPARPDFTLTDVLALLEREPGLADINGCHALCHGR